MLSISVYHFLVDIGAHVEGVDSGVREPIGEESGWRLYQGHGFQQFAESTVVKLVIGVVQVVPENNWYLRLIWGSVISYATNCTWKYTKVYNNLPDTTHSSTSFLFCNLKYFLFN